MSACHNLWLHSPLKTVFNKLGDTCQAYYNTYKTHTMATHHGGTGQPLDRDDTHMEKILNPTSHMTMTMRTQVTLGP